MAPTDYEHTVIWRDRFLNFRYPLEGYADHREKVKVAILDTGIDLCMFEDSPFLERIKDRKSFLSDADEPEQEGARNGRDSAAADVSVHDETPERHGSYIAKLILSYAPWADIYVARIVKDHKTPMDPNCFAKAIEHAVADWKVHIISISSGFGTSYECIEKAIHFAYEQGVAVLAAASNDGANRAIADQVPFPARMSEVICINSSDGYGNPSAFNPPAVDGTFNFMTLGESVPIPLEPDSHQRGEAHGENVHRETGTSFATPIAASIAACFMEFLLQNLLRKDKQVPKELHPRDVITRLFAGMSSSHNNFRYLRPWDLINCKPESENHKCSKTCRIRAADKVKQYLKSPVPAPEVKMPDLPHVPEAEFDAELQRTSKGQCLENTRVEVLKSIRKWIKSSPRQVVVGLLVGRAGSGKSAIARTVAQELSSDQCLGASFFFTRSQTKYGDAFDFVISVAYQLAKHRPRLAALVRNAIENDPDLRETSKSRRVQWQKLVMIPLMSVDTTTVILIDALDEAKQPSEILSLLQQLESIKARVTVFVTSRREIGIDNVVYNWQREPREFDLDSEFMFSDTHRDITHFVEQDLEFMNKSGPLTSLSVDEGDFRTLAEKANGLFVYAALACRYIRGSGNQSTTPKQRLKQVIDAHHFKDLDALYGGILAEATAGPDEQEVDRQLRHILGLVLTLRTPLPESVFHMFCPEEMNSELVLDRLNSLHSVLVVRTGPEQPVQVFHESFRSFLVENFGIDLKRAHRNIFSHCMKIMLKTLQMDICSIGNIGVDIKAIPSTAIDNCLPLEVKYACEYWPDHLENLDQADCEAAPLVDDGTVHMFLKKLFLHWLEALCLMEKIHVAIFSTRRLSQMVSGKDEALQLSLFVRDAQHFVQHNNWVLQHRPLQLYSSALIFSPTHSIVRMQFEHMVPECIIGQPAMDNDWPCFQSLESREPIRHVLFAPTAMMLATLGSGIVSIWDAETGRCIYELQHEAVARATFSSNSEILATGNATARIYDPYSRRRLGTLDSYSVNVWDLKTGASIKTLAYGKESIAGLAFSENSRWLAFASQDGIISIYDLNSKQCALNMDSVNVGYGGISDISLVFSQDSTRLVAALGPQGLKTWKIGPVDWELTSDDTIKARNIRSTVISSDGKTVALLYDTYSELELRDIASGTCLAALNHNGDRIDCIAFCSNSIVAYATSDEFHNRYAIHVWSLVTKSTLWKLKPRKSLQQMLFSPDAKWLASTKRRSEVQVWDMGTGKCFEQLKCPNKDIVSMSFSHDCSILALASDDRAIRLWDFMSEKPAGIDSSSSLTTYLSRAISSVTRLMASEDKETGKPADYHTKSHSNSITSLKMTDNGNVLISSSTDGIVYFFSVSDNECFRTLESTMVYSEAVYSPQNRTLAWQADEWDINVQSIIKRRSSMKPLKMKCSISPLALSPDGSLLAFTKMYKTIVIWNIKKNTVMTCDIPREYVTHLVFSYDNLYAAGAKGRKIYLLDTGSGKARKTFVLDSHAGEILSLAYTHDSRQLASLSNNGDVQIWDVDKGYCVYKVNFGAELKGPVLFDFQARCLLTDIGSFILPEAAPASLDALSNKTLTRDSGFGISLDNCWITRDSEDWLWLPEEYRPTRSTTRTIRAEYKDDDRSNIKTMTYIGIGCISGRVLLFKFESN